jgi:predicted component of type VI protein secretion system
VKKATLTQDDELIRKAVAVLVQQLGPVDAHRFLTLPAGQRAESVKRHREWQESLHPEAFFREVFKA